MKWIPNIILHNMIHSSQLLYLIDGIPIRLKMVSDDIVKIDEYVNQKKQNY